MIMYLPIALIVVSNIFYNVSSKSTPMSINPFASLTITYAVSAIISGLLYFVFNKGGNLISEYQHLNWSSFVLGITLVGLEVGSIYMYKVGWDISTGQLIYSIILAIFLIFIGALFYHEQITGTKMVGILACMVGLFLINK